MTANSPGDQLKNQSFWDAAPLEPHLLYQGEVLVDMPFLSMPKETRWLWVETRSGKPIDVALKGGGLGGTVYVHDSNRTAIKWDESPEGVFAIGRLSKRPMLILSQTCDIQNHDFIQVAPIRPVPREEGDEEFFERVMRGDIISIFPLEAHPPELPSVSYAEFELIQAVHKSYLRRPDPKKHFRLGPDQILNLQRAITRYFGRPNSFDAGSDKVPRAGTYMCVRCFQWDGVVTAVVRYEGDDFGLCPRCNDKKWTPQLGSFTTPLPK